MKEILSVQSAAAASLAHGGGVLELLDARGFYSVECLGPRQSELQRYVEIRDRLAAIRAHALRNIFRAREQLALKREFAAIKIEQWWKEIARNTVTTQGKNDLLDKYLAGSSYTAAFYCGLISSVSYSTTAATDTAAQINGTNGWKEGAASNAPNYSQSTRVALTFSSASAGSKATSSASVFSPSNTGTVKGAFASTVSTKEGTTGVLLSAGVFSGGDQPVVSGNTLNVSYSLAV